MSFGPLRLAAAGETPPQLAWDTIEFKGFTAPIDSTLAVGHWIGLRNDGRMFYSKAIAYREWLTEKDWKPGNRVYPLAVQAEINIAKQAIDTFLTPGCDCSATPKHVCPYHQEMFCQDEYGEPLALEGEGD